MLRARISRPILQKKADAAGPCRGPLWRAGLARVAQCPLTVSESCLWAGGQVKPAQCHERTHAPHKKTKQPDRAARERSLLKGPFRERPAGRSAFGAFLDTPGHHSRFFP